MYTLDDTFRVVAHLAHNDIAFVIFLHLRTLGALLFKYFEFRLRCTSRLDLQACFFIDFDRACRRSFPIVLLKAVSLLDGLHS